MKIAFITYEYPPDTAFGGIATYVYQIAQFLSKRGHHVEVFAASLERGGSLLESDIWVHRVLLKDKRARSMFSDLCYVPFSERHKLVTFDVVESAEAGAHARRIIEEFLNLPLVVKLHTPTYLITELGYVYPTIQQKLRWYLGSIRRFKIPTAFPKYDYQEIDTLEKKITFNADEITTPSIDLGALVAKRWRLSESQIHHIPNLYIPSQELLNIPCQTETNTISFIGRLETRKGILDFWKAVPLVLKQFPEIKFRFIGSGSAPSPEYGLDMQTYVAKKLRKFQSLLEFTGRVELDSIPHWLTKTDICVFPSIWENFPYTCLEAMAAGRGVVGSSAGGMAEMLDNGKAGLLIPPQDPQAIANAVCKLLADPALRMRLGQEARKRVLSEYNNERIGALQEASYERAIKRRRELGDRQQKS